MTLRGDLRPALRALGERPGVVVAAIAIAALGAAVPFVVDAVVGEIVRRTWTLPAVRLQNPPPGPDDVVRVLLGVGLIVPLVALFGTLFGSFDAPPSERRDTFRRLGGTARRSYAGFLAVAILGFLVAGVVSVVFALVWLPLDTAVRAVRYAIADPGPPAAYAQLGWLAGTLSLGFVLGGSLVRLADTAYHFDGRAPPAAIATSIRFGRHHPVSLAGFVLVVAGVMGAGFVVWLAIPAMLVARPLGPVVALLAGIPGMGITLAVVAALQATYYRRTVAPAVAALPERAPLPWGRIALAAVVLLAAVGGAAYVRSHEIRPLPADNATLPEDPSGAYATARSNTAARSYRSVRTSTNLTSGERSGPVTVAVDGVDRQLTLFIPSEPTASTTLGTYRDPGAVGSYYGGNVSSAAAIEDSENWSERAAPGYGLAIGGISDSLPLPDADATWTVGNRTDRELRLRLEDPRVVRRVTEGESFSRGHLSFGAGSYVEVVIDRRKRTVVQSESLQVTDTGRRYRTVTRIEDVGSVDVERPPALGEREPGEWLWATIYY